MSDYCCADIALRLELRFTCACFYHYCRSLTASFRCAACTPGAGAFEQTAFSRVEAAIADTAALVAAAAEYGC